MEHTCPWREMWERVKHAEARGQWRVPRWLIGKLERDCLGQPTTESKTDTELTVPPNAQQPRESGMTLTGSPPPPTTTLWERGSTSAGKDDA